MQASASGREGIISSSDQLRLRCRAPRSAPAPCAKIATPEDLAAAGRLAFPDYPASIQHEGVGEVSHGRYVIFQMAEVAIPRQMFQEILRPIAELRPQPPPAPA